MTEATPLTDDELRYLRSELPTIMDLYRQTPRSYDDMINADIARRLLATIADRDRIIAQAKVMAEQQALVIKKLWDQTSKPLPMDVLLNERDKFIVKNGLWQEFVDQLPNTVYHDSLHADALTTEAASNERENTIREVTAVLLGMDLDNMTCRRVAEDIVSAGFTRHPRQLDPGKVAKWLHDNLGHHISAERIDNHYAPMLVAADIWK